MASDKETSKSYTFVGDDDRFRGRTAKLRTRSPHWPNKVLAQFDEPAPISSSGWSYGAGWHEFSKDDFGISTDEWARLPKM